MLHRSKFDSRIQRRSLFLSSVSRPCPSFCLSWQNNQVGIQFVLIHRCCARAPWLLAAASAAACSMACSPHLSLHPYSLRAGVTPQHLPTGTQQQRGRSGRRLGDEAAEASRTFQTRTAGYHVGFSPALRGVSTAIDDRGGGGGGWGNGYCGTCGATSPSFRHASPGNGDSSPPRAATRAAYNAWVNRSSRSSPLRKMGGAPQDSAGLGQRGGDGGGSGGSGECGCGTGGRMRVSGAYSIILQRQPTLPDSVSIDEVCS